MSWIINIAYTYGDDKKTWIDIFEMPINVCFVCSLIIEKSNIFLINKANIKEKLASFASFYFFGHRSEDIYFLLNGMEREYKFQIPSEEKPRLSEKSLSKIYISVALFLTSSFISFSIIYKYDSWHFYSIFLNCYRFKKSLKIYSFFPLIN